MSLSRSLLGFGHRQVNAVNRPNPPLHLAFSGQMETRTMMIRDDIKAALVSGDEKRRQGRDRDDPADPVGDQEPRHRAAHRRRSQPDDDLLVTEVLQKMIKQRRELAELYARATAPNWPPPKRPRSP